MSDIVPMTPFSSGRYYIRRTDIQLSSSLVTLTTNEAIKAFSINEKSQPNFLNNFENDLYQNGLFMVRQLAELVAFFQLMQVLNNCF